jgi:hypothetical protein
MVLSPQDRREQIARAVAKWHPDLLICAGYSVDRRADLEWLANDKRLCGAPTTVIVEVQHDSPAVGPRSSKDDGLGSSHRVYLLEKGKPPRSLGNQTIVKGTDRSDKPMVAAFEGLIKEKTAQVEGHNLFALCCGEVNIVSGGEKVGVTSDTIGRALNDADIIVNPTHDRMSNRAGNLARKRQWLSRNIKGRKRVYVSVSNWNSHDGSGRSQNPRSDALHTLYVGGRQKASGEVHFPESTDPCVYREWELEDGVG